MLKTHMDTQENILVETSKIPANSGHSLHKGTPREIFIRKFLESHLPENVAIGTGEIIDSNSKPAEQRNQFDIVIYKKNYPKLDFGGGISGFLIESVIATVEVKSTLNQTELRKAIAAAKNAKKLNPNVNSSLMVGYIPPKILNYVIAYDGPQQMETVFNWIPKVHKNMGLTISNLPLEDNQRIRIPSPSIDGIFILKKGFVYFDNIPIGFGNLQLRKNNPNSNWIFANTQTGNLLLFFLFIQNATANLEGRWLNAVPYLSSFNLPGVLFGEE